MKTRPGLEISSLSDLGCQRGNNEDSLGYWEAGEDEVFTRLGRAAVVADGMGGAEGGQYASKIAVETVLEIYADANSLHDPQQRLVQSFDEANARVQQKAVQNPGLLGMGTTLTAFALVADHLYYAHVGDSRLYVWRAGELRQLTRDHSLVARLVANGIVRPEDAERHPQKHVLTAAVGVGDSLNPDVPAQPVVVEAGDVLLLCTDGLWGQMSDAEISPILSAQAPDAACRALVTLARERGGPDNITVQVARVG